MLRKAINLYYELFQFLLPIGSKSSLYDAANQYLLNNKVDAIIATGDPFILFKYASKLGTKQNTPWVADYRDVWTQDSFIQKRFILKKWN